MYSALSYSFQETIFPAALNHKQGSSANHKQFAEGLPDFGSTPGVLNFDDRHLYTLLKIAHFEGQLQVLVAH